LDWSYNIPIKMEMWFVCGKSQMRGRIGRTNTGGKALNRIKGPAQCRTRTQCRWNSEAHRSEASAYETVSRCMNQTGQADDLLEENSCYWGLCSTSLSPSPTITYSWAVHTRQLTNLAGWLAQAVTIRSDTVSLTPPSRWPPF